jgi:hypothetical protein
MIRITKYLIGCLAYLLICSLHGFSSDKPLELFQAGNAAYQAGDFARAREHYDAALAQTQSAPLYFNLGNAAQRLGDYGLAIYAYEKALRLAPGNPDIKANLALARRAADVAAPPASLLSHLAHFTTVNRWTLITVIFAWAGLIFLLLPRLGARRSGWTVTVGLLCWLVTLVGCMALWGYHQERDRGFIVSSDAIVRTSPAVESDVIVKPAAGTAVTLGRVHGGHVRVALRDGRNGWIALQDVAPLWPH